MRNRTWCHWGRVKLVRDGALTIQKAAVEADMTVSEFKEKYM